MANISDLDLDIIQKQLAVLETNSVQFTSKMYDLFVSTTPMDVELNVWVYDKEGQSDKLVMDTIKLPNRAKGNIPAKYGEGSPVGTVEASLGTLYVDTSDDGNGAVYIKKTVDGTDGWSQIMTQVELEAHENNQAAHLLYLARKNGSDSEYFNVKDVNEDDFDADPEIFGSYAINMRSLDGLLGGTKNLDTNTHENIVSAINEVVLANNYDAGCAVWSNAKDATTNNTTLFSIRDVNGTNTNCLVIRPFIGTSPDGRKHIFNTENMDYPTVSTGNQSGVIAKGTYSVYAIPGYALTSNGSHNKKEPDPTRAQIALVRGKYRKTIYRPYIGAEWDGWLDLSSVPYQFKIMWLDPSTETLKYTTTAKRSGTGDVPRGFMTFNCYTTSAGGPEAGDIDSSSNYTEDVDVTDFIYLGTLTVD